MKAMGMLFKTWVSALRNISDDKIEVLLANIDLFIKYFFITC